MAYDKRLNKSERKQIVSARRSVKTTGFRESEKHFNALRGNHIGTAKAKISVTA